MRRLYPPTAGMPAWRFYAQIGLIYIVHGIVVAVCWIVGHRTKVYVFDYGEHHHRWTYCERCGRELSHQEVP